MKKRFALLLSLVLIVTLFAACGKKTDGDKPSTGGDVNNGQEVDNGNTGKEDDTDSDNGNTEEPTDVVVKTGIAVITSAAKSKAATADAEGTAQFDSVVVGVLVDEAGKILACEIDTAQTKIGFSAAGAITTPAETVFKSKQELQGEYGMVGASPIGKEWFEQADAFAEYVVGKTVDEVKGIALEEGKAAVEELKSSVTMSVGGYIDAIVKAAENAKVLGAGADDKLGLGVTTTLDGSKDATADAAGKARAYSNYAAVSVNAEGKITSCAIDSSQSDVVIDGTGAIAADTPTEFKTKQELQGDYGMVGASPIGKEWFEQADAFAEYVTGKTLAEVQGIALEDNKATDAELATTVTMKVAGYIDVIVKAVSRAR